ncbi:ABC transporter permease [Streptomyces sp. NPDC015661]|uniref:ABC transporter permease n=1 Tax=Streptomyces sp. NPDC015661 TaxID=3364961 RepID=UPI0036FFB056
MATQPSIPAPAPVPAPAPGRRRLARVLTAPGPWGVFLLRRLGGLLVVAAVLVTATFAMVQLIPGDPARVVAGPDASPEALVATRHQLGLDQPLLGQLVDYVTGLLRGDLGTSFQTKESVLDIVATRLPFTAELAVGAVLLSLLIAVPLGMITAVRSSGRADTGFSMLTGLGGAVPEYVLGTLLVVLFGIGLGWLPAAGAATPGSLVMPIAALAVPGTCAIARIVHRETATVLAQDYMRTARARRLPPLRMYARHALPNLLTSTLTLGGLILAGLLGGTVVVESVFAWPGIGSRVVDAILARDYPVVQGCVLTLGLLAAVLNLLVDVLLGVLDPRTLITGGGES